MGKFEIVELSIVSVTEISEEGGGTEIGSMTSGTEAGDLDILLDTLTLVRLTDRFGTLNDLHSANSSCHFLHISEKSL